MYNQEVKEKFLSEHVNTETTKQNYLAIFNKTGLLEDKYKHDLFEMNVSELQETINSFNNTRIRSAIVRLGYIKRYIEWCFNNGICESCDNIDNVKIDKTAGIRTNTVKNPLHLQRLLNIVFQPESKNTIDNLYRCYYWLAYSGLSASEAFEIKVSDVDLLERKIKYNGEQYQVYEEGFACIKKCIELDYFIKEHPLYKNNTERKRTEGEFLLRGCTDKTNIVTIRSELSRAVKKHEGTDALTYYRIWISGIFYRQYQKEIAGEPVDFSKEAYKDIKVKKAKPKSSGGSDYSRVMMKERDYRRDYNLWKQTL